ncbi:hypothetical protein AFK68_30585 [Hydrocoleum sp. CS-953]|nr:hypothetical protein AFK68_30585 [Hydrocoleum sp. CS-953]
MVEILTELQIRKSPSKYDKETGFVLNISRKEGTGNSGATPRRRQTQTPVPSSRETRPTDWLGNAHQEREQGTGGSN